jgi:putative transcriptional regulator
MSRKLFAFLSTLLAAFAIATHHVHAADAKADAVLLVAQPKLVDMVYARTVLIVKPLPNGGHAGFIVNKPTEAHLGEVFPNHEPSKKVADPLYLGGPEDLNTVFALVERQKAVDDAVPIVPGVYLAVKGTDVDRVIESEADHARFLVGLVIWKPGELDAELDRGFWYQMDPDPKLFMRRDVKTLWQELMQKGEDRKHST